ncbi:MAG: aldose 1-epimerase family protein [Frankiales bacterium]|nr:aldose 1-epimerase family protein [Frankiales bacterium]
MTVHPSGQQFPLRHGTTEAVITEVGAGIRTFRVGDVEVLDGFEADEMCSGGRGQTLLPWANRVADGQYSWQGKDYQLPLSEPLHHNAIHGLTRWASWELIDLRVDRATLRHLLHPQPGWPFPLLCEIAYVVGEGSLSVTTTVTNLGARDCPISAGAHPYLSAGGGLVDECVLEVPGDTLIPVDARGLPTEQRPVAGSEDFRVPRRIGDQVIDVGYGGLRRGADGRTVARLARPDGVVLNLWAGPGYRYLQVFTGDTLPADRRRRGVALEPMTSPANALASGVDLDRLSPGQALSLTWGVSLVPEP